MCVQISRHRTPGCIWCAVHETHRLFLASAEIDNWGNEKTEMLISHYGEAKSQTWKSAEGVETPKESAPIIDAERTREEWRHPRSLLKSLMPREQGRSGDIQGVCSNH